MVRRPDTPHHTARTLVADVFDEGPDYSTTRRDGTGDYLLILTLDGRGLIGQGDAAWVTEPGDVVLFAPGVPQFYGTAPQPGRWHLAWAHFQPRTPWENLLDWPRQPDGVGRLRGAGAALRRQFMGLPATCRRPRRHAVLSGMNALERILLLCDELRPATQRIDPRIAAVRDAVAQDPAADWSVDTMADVAHLSPSRFAHVFRQDIGTSPRAFVEAMRLRRAAELLECTQLAVQAIAAHAGFDSAFYFSLRFKKAYGVPPSEWRGP